MGVVLIGKEQTRRTEYFLKASEELHIPVRFVDWDVAGKAELEGDVVKLDPPVYETSDLFEMNGQIVAFQKELGSVLDVGCRFLNPPAGIEAVLNKRSCKEILQNKGVPVTKMFTETIENVEKLHEVMDKHRTFSVFIKPMFCSGAAGVAAYRRVPGKKKATLYTSCCLQGEELVNTKTLYKLEDVSEIRSLLNAVLSLGTVVERWHPKASYQGKSFDLRAVWQFGRVEFIVARQSKGPVTNLHLNNSPLAFEKLGLSGRTLEEIQELCRKGMACFPELQMAGIDVLLEKDTMRPCIIEINGQGDLMYQDIFHENRIYKRQIEVMSRMGQEWGSYGTDRYE